MTQTLTDPTTEEMRPTLDQVTPNPFPSRYAVPVTITDSTTSQMPATFAERIAEAKHRKAKAKAK